MTVTILSYTHARTRFTHTGAHTHTDPNTDGLWFTAYPGSALTEQLSSSPWLRLLEPPGADGPDRAGHAAHPYGFGWKDASLLVSLSPFILRPPFYLSWISWPCLDWAPLRPLFPARCRSSGTCFR